MAEGQINLPVPFAYPAQRHVRRHGPQGSSHYRQYRNWLRDEFSFRCVYCLRRETWATMPRDFEIDHVLPKRDYPELERDYDNLVYACAECNGTKAVKLLPAPESVAYGDCLRVDHTGEISALNERGKEIIEALRLNAPKYTQLRRLFIRMTAEAAPGSETLRCCLGYPDGLPNLSVEKEPKHNKRPKGIHDSHYERKRRGELPDYY